MIIRKTFHLEMAHKLDNYDGKCKNLHGHSYFITVELEGDTSSNGMLLDFNIIKELWKPIDEQFDHSTMLGECAENEKLIRVLREMGSNLNVVPFNPTAEHMSMYFCDILSTELRNYIKTHTITNFIRVKSVSVEETRGAEAYYVNQ